MDSTYKVSILLVWHMVLEESSFLQVILLPISSLKTLLEIDHYTRTVFMLFFPLSGYPNSHQYLKFLGSLIFQCLIYLFLVVKQNILTVTIDLLLLFPLQLMLYEYCACFILLDHLL
jgi:hypothetical protein